MENQEDDFAVIGKKILQSKKAKLAFRFTCSVLIALFALRMVYLWSCAKEMDKTVTQAMESFVTHTEALNNQPRSLDRSLLIINRGIEMTDRIQSNSTTVNTENYPSVMQQKIVRMQQTCQDANSKLRQEQQKVTNIKHNYHLSQSEEQRQAEILDNLCLGYIRSVTNSVSDLSKTQEKHFKSTWWKIWLTFNE
jgi:cell division protein ZapA (FtsZ GTPase activity inhibitor)